MAKAKKRKGKKRAARRRPSRSYGTVRLTKRAKRGRKKSFKLKNPWRVGGKGYKGRAYKGKLFTAKQVAALKRSSKRRGKRSPQIVYVAESTASRKSAAPRAARAIGRLRAKRKGKRRKSAVRKAARRAPKKKKGARRLAARRAGARRRYGKKFRGRRVRVTLKHRGRMKPWLKRALVRKGYLARGGVVRNPSRRRGRRRNPGGFLEQMRQQFSAPAVVQAAQVALIGIPAATVLPAVIEQVSGGRVRNEGGQGVLLSAASATAATIGAAWIERFVSARGREAPMLARNLARNVGLAGLLVTVLRGTWYLAPKLADYLRLPMVSTLPVTLPRIMGGAAAAPMPAPAVAAAMRGLGYGGGIGYNDPNEALIAGESFSRSVSQFEGMGGVGDWMELRGMGRGGVGDWMELRGLGADYRVPMQDIRGPGQLLSGYPGQYGGGSYDPYGANALTRYGYSGMGDWVESAVGGPEPFGGASFQPAQETF